MQRRRVRSAAGWLALVAACCVAGCGPQGTGETLPPESSPSATAPAATPAPPPPLPAQALLTREQSKPDLTKPENKPYILGIRIVLILLFLTLSGLVYKAWKKRKGKLDISDQTIDIETNKG